MVRFYLPPIVFSSWVKWKDRTEIEGCEHPGVYILAELAKIPAGPANPLDSGIIYVGETCKSLKERWNQFDASAFRGKERHSGGMTYAREKRDNDENLKVSAFPVPLNPRHLQEVYIRFVERKIILDYVINHGRTPKINHK